MQMAILTPKLFHKRLTLKNKFSWPTVLFAANCPRCGAENQYGDNCEVCGSTYDPLELKNPVSILSGGNAYHQRILSTTFLI